jgi:hypothetical protein
VRPAVDHAVKCPADAHDAAAHRHGDPRAAQVAECRFLCYIHDTDPDQALVSPLRADLSGLPPLLIPKPAPR